MIKEASALKGILQTGQIIVDRETGLIGGVLFKRDPGENGDNVNIDKQDINGYKRRRARILATVKALSPDICDLRIDVGWAVGLCSCEYIYLPYVSMLRPSFVGSKITS